MMNKSKFYDKIQKSERNIEEGRLSIADAKISVKKIDELILGGSHDSERDNKSTEES
jgi:hypothetical protein